MQPKGLSLGFRKLDRALIGRIERLRKGQSDDNQFSVQGYTMRSTMNAQSKIRGDNNNNVSSLVVVEALKAEDYLASAEIMMHDHWTERAEENKNETALLVYFGHRISSLRKHHHEFPVPSFLLAIRFAMRLLLVRHGETVDNVAQVYAGITDSALTIHGNLQAERLGKYLAEKCFRFRSIFSSDLQRALKTATAISLAQPRPDCDAAHEVKSKVTALTILREQDFGFYERKPFYTRSKDSSRTGKENHRSQHQDDPDFKDVESKESMALRMSCFLRDYLVPAIRTEISEPDSDIVVVSHGIILSQFWRSFLKLVAKNSVTLSPGLSVGTGAITPLEYLGGWSNTGYLELEILKKESVATSDLATSTTAPPTPDLSSSDSDASLLQHQYQVIIKTINGKEHLRGLKRTRGVGSSRFDEGQKSIESFFKKRKV